MTPSQLCGHEPLEVGDEGMVDHNADEMTLRARIRFAIDIGATDVAALEHALALALSDTLAARHAQAVSVQLSASLDPAWAGEGPALRILDGPLAESLRGHDPSDPGSDT